MTRCGIRSPSGIPLLLGIGWPPCHPRRKMQRANLLRERSPCIATSFFCARSRSSLARRRRLCAADSERCQGLARRYEIAKPQITAIEVSLTLFAAVDANCLDLATATARPGRVASTRATGLARGHSATPRESGHLQMVDLLLARGAPIDARNLAGSTALYFAAEGSHILIAQRLIERGADVNLTGRSGISPIAAAAYAGNDIIFDALLAHGADERAPDDTGKPPIVYAAAGARFDIVKRLLARNIDVNARYANDLTLLMWASGPDEGVPEAQAIEGRFVSAGRRRAYRRSG